MGYHRAGFEVVGVDIKFQKNYPFEFHQADAMTFPLSGFDVIHASPPCHAYSVCSNIHTCRGKDYPKLIDAVREKLLDSGKPFVIENVVGAPLLSAFMLCGLMFNLKVLRHRLFETNAFFFIPQHPSHRGIEIGKDGFCCVVGHSAVKGNSNYQYPNKKFMWVEATGIDWMTKQEMTQAIPPAYTEFIGKQLMESL
jgi:DNA (cytosine-5)-methyltransferase 1